MSFENNNLNFFVGLYTLLALIVLIICFANNIPGRFFPSQYNTYYIPVNNTIGMRIGNSITYSGYPIGYINAIYLDKHSPVMVIKVKKNINLTTDVLVRISNISLFSSSKFVSITNGIEEEYIENGTVITNSTLPIELDTLIDMVSAYLGKK